MERGEIVADEAAQQAEQIAEYSRRERRFGGLAAKTAS
jgi:hypothetical protein